MVKEQALACFQVYAQHNFGKDKYLSWPRINKAEEKIRNSSEHRFDNCIDAMDVLNAINWPHV